MEFCLREEHLLIYRTVFLQIGRGSEMHPQLFSESFPLSFLLSPIPKNGALISLGTIFNSQLMVGQWNWAASPLSHGLGCVRVVDGFTTPSSSLDSAAVWRMVCCIRKTLPASKPVKPLLAHFAFWSEVMETASQKYIHFMASVETGSSAKGNMNFQKPSKQFGSGLRGKERGMAVSLTLPVVKWQTLMLLKTQLIAFV